MISRAYNLRGIVGSELNERIINKFSKNLINYIYSNNLSKCIVVGMDNRVSSCYIKSVIQAQLLKYGIKVLDIGECTTPQLVYMLKNFRASVGVMITASHNSCEYNGVKCFNNSGESINITDLGYKRVKREYNYEKAFDISKYKELYIRDLKNSLIKNNIKCIFDCANGVTCEVVRKVFGKTCIINSDKSGLLINNNSGTEYLQVLINMCKKNKKIGFAFDGDGDRIVVVSSDGEVIDGDKILYILATQYLYNGDVIVGTQLTSLALEVSLRRLGVGLIRTEVGINNVCAKLKQNKCVIGGESCGHIVIDKIGVADGVYIAILILNIINRTKLGLNELLKGYKHTYQLSRNIDLKLVKNNDYNGLNTSTINSRIVVRKSNTEPLLRILIEGESKEIAEKLLKEIYSVLGVDYEQ